jgi:hypothetical protein
VWSLHAYDITWDKLPMTDVSTVEAQISEFSDYLAAIPADATLPVWLTEFGVIWGYDGFQGVSSGCATSPSCFAPTGSFDTTAVSTFLNGLVAWLATSGPQYRIDRWFVYTTVGSPEPYATTYAGISLFSSGTLTADGQSYRDAALPTAMATSHPTPPAAPGRTAGRALR